MASTTTNAEVFQKIHPLEFYKTFVHQGIRPDGRSLLKFRKTVITQGSITSTLGSAMIRLGNTSVVAGVRGAVRVAPPVVDVAMDDGDASGGDDDDDRQALEGVYEANLELLPLCSSMFRPGRPSQQAVAMTDSLNRLLKSSKTVDLSSLTVANGECVWDLSVSLYCLDYDGNVFDAALLALVVALKDARLPQVLLSDTREVELDKTKFTRLTLNNIPISSTFGLLNDHTVGDPSHEEEGLLDTTFSIIYNPSGSLMNVKKDGGAPLPDNIFKTCAEKAKRRAVEVGKMIEVSSREAK